MEQVFATNLSYEHYFAPWLSASSQESYVHSVAGETLDGLRERAASVLGNVVVHPTPQLDLAVEYMRALRKDDSLTAQRRSLLRVAGRLRN
jgi:hypothetical protein